MMIADGESLMDWPVAARRVCVATVIIVPPARPPAMSMVEGGRNWVSV